MWVAAAACMNQAEVRRAKSSIYDAEFAQVYNAVIKAVRHSYAKFDEDASSGAVRTSWYPLSSQGQSDDPRSAALSSQAQGFTQGNPNGTTTTTAAATPRGVGKRQFVRFDITVSGVRPYRVRVVGHASEWDPGMAVPTELHGAAIPGALAGRVDALTVEIYRRLKKVAVADPVVAVKVAVAEPKRTDAKKFAGVPDAAATALANLNDVLNLRANDALRNMIDAQAVWSLGAEPSGDTAFAMWQADPSVLDAMKTALGAGCGGGASGSVVCPALAVTDQTFNGWRLTLTARSGTWKISEFVQGR
jgi:hypothetical protein